MAVQVGLVSAKGTPGVTTTAAALAATAGGVMVEADPSGGSLECWAGPLGEPGLIALASSFRRAYASTTVIDDVVTTVRPGLRAVAAPVNGTIVESTLVAIGDRFGDLAGPDGVIVVDGGRWSASQTSSHRLTGCAVIGLVCAPTVESVSAARWLVGPLAQTCGVPVRAVLVGDRPFGPAEVADAVGAGVAGAVPVERQSVSTLWSHGTTRGWVRSGLARAARDVLHGLLAAARPAGVFGDG